MPKPPSRRLSAAAIVFGLLVLATVAAFAWAQRLKRDPLVLDKVTFVGYPLPHDPEGPRKATFTPNDDCRNDKIRIRFRTTVSDDGTVQIIRPSGHMVLTLARDEFLKRYHFHTFYWNGRQRNGSTAPPGRYKLRVKLLGEDRVLVPPGSIHLHRPPPKELSACTTRARGGGVPAEPKTGSGP
ncbi:MAG TPA: hypothetical protein VFJ57_05595 [Solirubrobacterales bacterium]|nr:hypothetical protein [Solirubrobacterales bacterium]